MTKVHLRGADGLPACGTGKGKRWGSCITTTIRNPESKRIDCLRCLAVLRATDTGAAPLPFNASNPEKIEHGH